MGKVIVCLIVSCLATAGSAVALAVVIAIVDIYLSGHGMEPGSWASIREWIFIAVVVTVFFITLLVSIAARRKG